MFRIEIEIRVVDDETGEVAKAHHGDAPVVIKSQFYPLFDQAVDGENLAHAIQRAIIPMMHVGSEFYRVGSKQKDL